VEREILPTCENLLTIAETSRICIERRLISEDNIYIDYASNFHHLYAVSEYVCGKEIFPGSEELAGDFLAAKICH
jgi:hypothetical protein